MTNLVYVIRWTYGEYSQRREGISGIVREEEIARQTVVYLQREMQRVGREYIEWSNNAPPFDEEFDEGPRPDGYDRLEASIPDKSISTLSTDLEDIQYSYASFELKDTLIPSKEPGDEELQFPGVTTKQQAFRAATWHHRRAVGLVSQPVIDDLDKWMNAPMFPPVSDEERARFDFEASVKEKEQMIARAMKKQWPKW